jgi:hypothetical protein
VRGQVNFTVTPVDVQDFPLTLAAIRRFPEIRETIPAVL